MVATKKGRKSLNIFMCEIVYTAIVMSLQKHSGIYKSTRDAINHFIKNSETFTALKEGKLHNDFIQAMKRNTPDKLLDYQNRSMHDPEEIKKDMEELGHAYIEPETGEQFTEQDLKDMEQERDRIKLEINRVVDPEERSEKPSTGLTDRAYKQIWRMCQAYEEYCIETKQPGPLPLNIIRQDQN